MTFEQKLDKLLFYQKLSGKLDKLMLGEMSLLDYKAEVEAKIKTMETEMNESTKEKIQSFDAAYNKKTF